MISAFDQIYGNHPLKNTMIKMLREKQLSHGYVFYGDEGIGKSLIVNTFIKGVLCQAPMSQPCGACQSCRVLDLNNHPDLIRVTTEQKSIGVEVIREQVNRDIHIKPYGLYKIYVIDKAHTMTPSAQNALLKVLEEPPQYAMIILIADNLNQLLHTVRSRLTTLKVQPVTMAELNTYLQRTDRPHLQESFYLNYCGGNIGQLERMLTDTHFAELRELAFQAILQLEDLNLHQVFEFYQNIEEKRDEVETLILFMTLILRDSLFIKEGDVSLINVDRQSDIAEYAAKLETEVVLGRIQTLYDTAELLRKNANFQMTIELMLLKLRKT